MNTSALIQTLLSGLNATYALLDAQNVIIRCAADFALQAGDGEPADPTGQSLFEVLPELFGQEEILDQIRAGSLPFWRLGNVARSTRTGEIRYLQITLAPGETLEPGTVVVILSNVTEQGELLQELTQNRNELRLLRAQLTQSNNLLDYLLRHYIPGEIADALLKGELRPDLGGELREVSILFADARNFTSLSERAHPEVIVRALNTYLEKIADAVYEFGGVINQFQGDNIMVIFNAQGRQPQHARLATQAGIAAQKALRACRALCERGNVPLDFGIGIHTGRALVGNVGAHWRYTYTAIGDTTNLASRITSVTPGGEVWVSQTTYERLGSAFPAASLPPILFKGKSSLTRLWRVFPAPAESAPGSA